MLPIVWIVILINLIFPYERAKKNQPKLVPSNKTQYILNNRHNMVDLFDNKCFNITLLHG